MPRPSSALFAPIGAALLFGGSYIAAKIASRELSPITTTFLRYLPAIALLAILAARARASLRVQPRDYAWMAWLGLTGIVGYHYFFFTALQHTSAVNTAVINASSPIITAILAALLLRERLAPKSYAGILLSVAGVLLVLSRGELSTIFTGAFNHGDQLMLLSVSSWAGYSLAVKRLSPRYDSLTLSLWAMVSGEIILAPPAYSGDLAAETRAMSPKVVAAVLYMGLAASGLGYLFYNRSIAAIGPTKTSSVVYSLVPLIVALLSWLVLDEAITMLVAIGAALIIAGLNLALRSPKA